MDLLEKLVNLDGVSGDEHDVRNFIMKEAKKYCKDVRVDAMGNVIVHKKGVKPTILFLAHMDEVGLMVRAIDARGRLRIAAIGGMDPSILVGQRVHIKATSKDVIQGVITTDDVLNGLDIPEKPRMEDLFVYTGLSPKDLDKAKIRAGTYVVFGESYKYCTLGDTNVISGKALDDRIGCYTMLQLLKSLKCKNEVYFVFTVQEEVGLYGAKASIFDLDPDYAIAIDVSSHDNFTDSVLLGKGPVLTVKDAEMLGNKCLNEDIQHVAEKLKMPLQMEVSEAGATDAASVFAAKGGIPSTVVGVSVANIHTTISIARREDIEDLVKLLTAFLRNPPTKCWR